MPYKKKQTAQQVANKERAARIGVEKRREAGEDTAKQDMDRLQTLRNVIQPTSDGLPAIGRWSPVWGTRSGAWISHVGDQMTGEYQATIADDEEIISIWADDIEIDSKQLGGICLRFAQTWGRWPVLQQRKGAA